jgi:hypothetical protein
MIKALVFKNQAFVSASCAKRDRHMMLIREVPHGCLSRDDTFVFTDLCHISSAFQPAFVCHADGFIFQQRSINASMVFWL